MYILLVIIASISSEPAKVNTYTVDTLEECLIQEGYVSSVNIPNEVIIQTGCYVKGDYF